MRSITTGVLLVLLCACDDPGDSSSGTKTTCDQAMRTLCTNMVEVRETWVHLTDGGEIVELADVPSCIDRLDAGGQGVRSVTRGVPPTPDYWYAFGCAFDNGSVDWEPCAAAAAAISGDDEATEYEALAACRIELDAPAE